MKKNILSITLLITLFFLNGCNTRIFYNKCNTKYNVSEEQVRNDLEDNREDYLEVIDIITKDKLQIIEIFYDQQSTRYNGIYITVYN